MQVTFNRFDECTWDRFVDVAADGRRVALAPTFLLTHEMGVTTGVQEEITSEKWGKVVFDLPRGKPRAALLLWYVKSVSAPDPVPTHLLVNGRPILHRTDPAKMLTGGWDRHEIPPANLRAGLNEVVFAQHGTLRLDPGEGKSSFRSFDGGKTWHANAFGPNNDAPGEYMVRLRLHGHPPRGAITSPVIDLADPADAGRIAPRMSLESVALAERARLPKDTSISFEMRSGSTPTFDPTSWTPWRRTRSLAKPGRFVQWRAALHTRRMDATPVLTAVLFDVKADIDRTGLDQYHVVEWQRPALQRSSYPFSSLAPHPRAERLARQYRLDQVVAPGRTEFERLGLLREWVHRQWYGWQADRYPYCPSWDPLEILDTVKNNWGFGMCTHYASTFVGCAAALGYPTRVVIIDHHCLAEVWIHDLGRWILMDAGLSRESHALYELDGKPLNALEVHQAIASGRAADLREHLFPQNDVRPMRKTLLDIFCRFGIVLRNNHLVQPEPAELAHGYGAYHWDGYLWWTDDAVPKYPEYSIQSRRPADFYWAVGRVRIRLQVVDDLGRLHVHLEHTMPNFRHYLVRLNGGAWKQAEARFEWSLEAGGNVLEAKAVSAFDHEGPAASVKVYRGARPAGKRR